MDNILARDSNAIETERKYGLIREQRTVNTYLYETEPSARDIVHTYIDGFP